MNALTTYAHADSTLDAITTAPAAYAEALTALVADGWADRLPLDVKGRPSGDVADAKREAQEAFRAAGVTGAPALRQRVLRMTYALHILAANTRRDGETDEAYVARVGKIRTIANGGEREAVDRAIKGKPAAPKAPKAPGKRGPGKAGGKAPKAPEAPKAANPAEAYEAAQNALVAAASAYLDALAAHRKAGGKVTKASAQQVTHRMNAITAALAS